MGNLIWGSIVAVPIEDRALAHLQPIIHSKLRRGESLPFSWMDTNAHGLERASIWLSPSISLVFEYFGSRQPQLNPAWLELLRRSANSTAGLQLVPEPRNSESEQA